MSERGQREDGAWKRGRRGRRNYGRQGGRGGRTMEHGRGEEKEERGYWPMPVWDPDWYTER